MVSGRKHNRKLVKLLDYSELVSYKYLPKMIKMPCKSISSKGFDENIESGEFASRSALIQTASLRALHSDVKMIW